MNIDILSSNSYGNKLWILYIHYTISKNAVQRPREAYFINRHTTFWKEETFNVSEHQNFLKSIKKSLRKVKKSEKNRNF